MSCNTRSNFHVITDATYTAGTSLAIKINNSTNISNRQRMYICVTKNIDAVVTGAPVLVYININGTNIPVYTKFGAAYPLYSDLLAKHYRNDRPIKAYYINDGGDNLYLIMDLPFCDCANVTGAS